MKRTEYTTRKDPKSGRSADDGSRVIKRKTGRNEPCPCGRKNDEGRPMKFKHCHLE